MVGYLVFYLISPRSIKRLVLGSVAEAVVQRATCAVFIVKTQVRNPLNVTNGTRRSLTHTVLVIGLG